MSPSTPKIPPPPTPLELDRQVAKRDEDSMLLYRAFAERNASRQGRSALVRSPGLFIPEATTNLP